MSEKSKKFNSASYSHSLPDDGGDQIGIEEDEEHFHSPSMFVL